MKYDLGVSLNYTSWLDCGN